MLEQRVLMMGLYEREDVNVSSKLICEWKQLLIVRFSGV
jgi:hypothetical protein